MRVVISVSKVDSPILARRLHETGIEPDIRQLENENHLVVHTEKNLNGMLRGMEATIIENPPEDPPEAEHEAVS